MPTVSELRDLEDRMKHLRAGVRLNSRVAIALHWSEEGRELRAEGFTIDVSPKGCLAIVKQGFTVGQRLLVENLANGQITGGVLVWRGHEGREGWELGLELQGAEFGFWGLEF